MEDVLGRMITEIISSPLSAPILVALAVLYLAAGICARHASRAWTPAKEASPGAAPSLPAGTHPVLADALLYSELLRKENNHTTGIAQWTCACALHALGTNGSVRIGPRGACEPTDTTKNAYRWGGDASLRPDLDGLEIQRVGTVTDKVDATMLEVLLPTGAEARRRREEAIDSLRAAGKVPEDRLAEYAATLDEQDGAGRSAATLLGMIGELHEDYWTVSSASNTARGQLAAMAREAGYLREGRDPFGWLRLVGGSVLILVHALGGMLVFGNADLLPEPARVGLWLGCIILDFVTIAGVFPRAIPLTEAGMEVTNAATRILGARPEELVRLPERKRLDAACLLVARDSDSEVAQGLARLLERESRPGSWQEAYCALCRPVRHEGHGHDKPVSLAGAFRSEMSTADIYESD